MNIFHIIFCSPLYVVLHHFLHVFQYEFPRSTEPKKIEVIFVANFVKLDILSEDANLIKYLLLFRA